MVIQIVHLEQVVQLSKSSFFIKTSKADKIKNMQ